MALRQLKVILLGSHDRKSRKRTCYYQAAYSDQNTKSSDRADYRTEVSYEISNAQVRY